MNQLLETINRPASAFRAPRRALAWGLVAAAALTDAVVDPVFALWANGRAPDFARMSLLLLAGLASYALECAGFWAICRALGSRMPLRGHLDAWGLTFPPTVVAALALAFTESWFYLFWNNTLLCVLFNAVFVGALLWKALLYGLYLRVAAGLSGRAFWLAFVLCGLLVALLALANMAVGLKTPVL